MLSSLRNNESSTSNTYKSKERSHVKKTTALLDKSNLQTLEERKIDQIPGSVRKKKLHKARKLFAKAPSGVDNTKEKPEIDELDLILMDMHKANEIRLKEKPEIHESALILMDMRKDNELCEAQTESHAFDQMSTTQDITDAQESIGENVYSKTIHSENLKPVKNVDVMKKSKVDVEITVDQFLVGQEAKRTSDQQKLLEDDLVVGKGEFACMGTSKNKMIFSTAIKFYKKLKKM